MLEAEIAYIIETVSEYNGKPNWIKHISRNGYVTTPFRDGSKLYYDLIKATRAANKLTKDGDIFKVVEY